MSFSIFSLSILTILLIALIIWLLSSSKKNSKTLVLGTSLLILLGALGFFGYDSLSGMPKTSELPEEFILIYFTIDEPEYIYLWIEDEDSVPVSYRIPYEEATHAGLQKVEDQLNKRIKVKVKKSEGNGDAEEGEGEGTKGGSSDGLSGNQKYPDDTFEFEIMLPKGLSK